MYHIVNEDTILLASPSQNGMSVTVIDTFHKKSHSFDCDNAAWIAIVVLAAGAGEDRWDGYDIDLLYVKAQAALKDCPPDIYPIP